MSFPCPHCGGEIVVVPGSSPFPGWGEPSQSVAIRRNPESQSSSQSSSQSGIARKVLGSEDLSSKALKPYNKGYNAQFVAFWKACPLKRDKRKALAAWERAIRRNSPEVILAGMERYRDDPNREDGFTKYPSTWLNGDCWEDEPLPIRLSANGRRPPDPPRPMTSGEMDREIARALGKETPS